MAHDDVWVVLYKDPWGHYGSRPDVVGVASTNKQMAEALARSHRRQGQDPTREVGPGGDYSAQCWGLDEFGVFEPREVHDFGPLNDEVAETAFPESTR
jgi:hypothetical protein